MNFKVHICLAITHTKIQNFPTPRFPHAPFSSVLGFNPTLRDSHCFEFSHHRLDWPLLKLRINLITESVVVHVWLLRLRIMF